MPHHAFKGQTPNEMYFGKDNTIDAEIKKPEQPHVKHGSSSIDSEVATLVRAKNRTPSHPARQAVTHRGV